MWQTISGYSGRWDGEDQIRNGSSTCSEPAPPGASAQEGTVLYLFWKEAPHASFPLITSSSKHPGSAKRFRADCVFTVLPLHFGGCTCPSQWRSSRKPSATHNNLWFSAPCLWGSTGAPAASGQSLGSCRRRRQGQISDGSQICPKEFGAVAGEEHIPKGNSGP